MVLCVIIYFVQIVPFTECKLTVREQQIKESSLVPRRFTEKGCVETKRSIPHRKLMPECMNVTKANCVLTNWETDEYGNQVWAGNEACDPITWQECKLVPKDVKLCKYIFDISSKTILLSQLCRRLRALTSRS